jgi:hypothetical protein
MKKGSLKKLPFFYSIEISLLHKSNANLEAK